jgi:hypothetical protein
MGERSSRCCDRVQAIAVEIGFPDVAACRVPQQAGASTCRISGSRGLPRSPSKLGRPLVGFPDVVACRVPPTSWGVRLSDFRTSRLAAFLQQAGASACRISGCRGLPRSPSKLGRPLVGFPDVAACRVPPASLGVHLSDFRTSWLAAFPSKLGRPLVGFLLTDSKKGAF